MTINNFTNTQGLEALHKQGMQRLKEISTVVDKEMNMSTTADTSTAKSGIEPTNINDIRRLEKYQKWHDRINKIKNEIESAKEDKKFYANKERQLKNELDNVESSGPEGNTPLLDLAEQTEQKVEQQEQQDPNRWKTFEIECLTKLNSKHYKKIKEAGFDNLVEMVSQEAEKQVETTPEQNESRQIDFSKLKKFNNLLISKSNFLNKDDGDFTPKQVQLCQTYGIIQFIELIQEYQEDVLIDPELWKDSLQENPEWIEIYETVEKILEVIEHRTT
jgi:hypothetical protein